MLVELLILFGAVAGGLVSGLTGFGTGLTVLALWLMVIPPTVAAPLVVICSVVAQLQTLPSAWGMIDWRRIWPFLLGGLIGIPVGTELLGNIGTVEFKAVIGILLLGYCSLMLTRRTAPKVKLGGRWMNGIVGVGGGILGGFAGLSGILPSVWATLKHWSKDEARSIFQTFNLTVLAVSGISMTVQGFLTLDVAKLSLFALPGTIFGAWLGRRLYGRLSDEQFNRTVLVLLMLAGASLIVTSIHR